METHLAYLERQIHDLGKHPAPMTRAVQFEYYSAIYMTLLHKKPFYVWKDITPRQKEAAGFPINDKGIDIAEPSFDIVGQAKYYGVGQSIGYGTLSTFLAMPILSGKNLNLNLLRTDHSRITTDIQTIVKGGRLIDSPICDSTFLETCAVLETTAFLSEEKKQEYTLNVPQIEAKTVLHESDKEGRNVIIHIPTGLGKTIMTLDYERLQKGCTLIMVPTLVLVHQWFDEALKMGFKEGSIYRIGCEDKNTFTEENLSSRLVICVYNSFPIVLPYFHRFRKVIIDEAHRVFTSSVYDEQNYEIEEDEENEDEKNTDGNQETYITHLRTAIRGHTASVLLSATIDPIANWLYYSYSVRDAIKAGYIADYQLICPIFNDDPSDRNVAEYIIKKGEAHCIIYTSTIEKCESFATILNRLLPGSAAFIHSGISKSQRQEILARFDSGELRFAVNVKVLAEGFNSPVCSSILFLHVSSNDTFTIQCIGRALRLHPSKTVANVYLPFHTESQEKQICTFLQHLCQTDPVFQHTCQTKTVGTYLTLERGQVDGKEETNTQIIEHRYDLVYDRMGTCTSEDVWERRRQEWVAMYQKLQKRPSVWSDDKDEKRVSTWSITQRREYRMGTLATSKILKLTQTTGWEWVIDTWPTQLANWITQYQKNGKPPCQIADDLHERKAANWQTKQRISYNKGVLADKYIQQLNQTEGWTWGTTEWLEQLEDWKKHYKMLGKKPSQTSSNPDIARSGQWQNQQRIRYKRGKLLKERFDILNQLPGWTWSCR